MHQSQVRLLVTIFYCVIDVAFSYPYVISADQNNNNYRKLNDDSEISPRFESILGVYNDAAVSADGVPCAQIGTNILLRNGTAIDAAIASLFCLGVVNTQSTGMGGGFLLTFYQKSTGQVFTLDARESAPSAANSTMYVDNSAASVSGGLAVAVPGDTRGSWEAYQRFGGGVSWAELIEPTIDLCTNGWPVNYHMASALKSKEAQILSEPTMSIFVNASTGSVYNENDTMVRNDLVPTLRQLQTEPESFYTGSLSTALQADLASLGSIITSQDLADYQPKWRDPISVSIQNGGYTIHSIAPPGSGVIYSYILNILDNYDFTSDDLNSITTYQRIVESFKFAYAERTKLGDSDFADMTQLINDLTSDAYAFNTYRNISDNSTSQRPEDYGAQYSSKDQQGTSHLSVLAANGDAVAVTSTVNFAFGAVIRSENTGIVLNNEMNDFVIDPFSQNEFGFSPSPNNYIEPGKRPRSSMSPSILVDSNGDARLAIGAAGGSHITTSTSWASIRNLWLGEDIKSAIDSERLHHPLMPMELKYEEGFSPVVLSGLEQIGHITDQYSTGTSVVCGISRENGLIYANSDYRKRGEVDGY